MCPTREHAFVLLSCSYFGGSVQSLGFIGDTKLDKENRILRDIDSDLNRLFTLSQSFNVSQIVSKIRIGHSTDTIPTSTTNLTLEPFV